MSEPTGANDPATPTFPHDDSRRQPIIGVLVAVGLMLWFAIGLAVNEVLKRVGSASAGPLGVFAGASVALAFWTIAWLVSSSGTDTEQYVPIPKGLRPGDRVIRSAPDGLVRAGTLVEFAATGGDAAYVSWDDGDASWVDPEELERRSGKDESTNG